MSQSNDKLSNQNFEDRASSDQVFIFDTTLRDGQQCPGAGMTFAENLQYARLARDLRVDVLEAGFPAASKVDFDIVAAIAAEYGSDPQAPVVAALCQLRDEQIDVTIKSLEPAMSRQNKKPRLHVYVPVAPELMRASLGDKADKRQIEKDVANFIARATKAGLEVEFSPEGYSRMGENFDFTTDLICAAVEAGALVINCPDTIGGASVLEGEQYFVQQMNAHAAIISQRFPERRVIWSMHCHNDFGLAVANSIQGVVYGPARQIEGCINGVGERAGNAALEQVILIIDAFGRSDTCVKELKKREEVVGEARGLWTGVDLAQLGRATAFVAKQMLPQQPHSPVSGANAVRHSSGGHTNAVLNNPLAYQPFDPQRIGREISLCFGPLSGGNHAKSVIEAAGYRCEHGEKAEIAQHIKDVYRERRKGITDEELLQGYFSYRSPIEITEFNYSRREDVSELLLRGKFFDRHGEVSEVNQGKDSALAALKKAIDRYFTCHIENYQSRSEGAGINALSVSTIVLSCGDNCLYTGNGKDQDIEIAAMRALIDAVNQAYVQRHYKLGEEKGGGGSDERG